jgi:hypothetical protein
MTAIPNALARSRALADGDGTISSQGALNAPLGLDPGPNGVLLAANGNDGNVVELSPAGKQVGVKTLIKHGAGDLFGLTMASDGSS